MTGNKSASTVCGNQRVCEQKKEMINFLVIFILVFELHGISFISLFSIEW